MSTITPIKLEDGETSPAVQATPDKSKVDKALSDTLTALASGSKKPASNITKKEDIETWKIAFFTLNQALEHNHKLQLQAVQQSLDLNSHLKVRIANKDTQINAFRGLIDTYKTQEVELKKQISDLQNKVADLTVVSPRGPFPGRGFPYHKRDRVTFESHFPPAGTPTSHVPALEAPAEKKANIQVDLTRDY